jgi:hypothetical protein
MNALIILAIVLGIVIGVAIGVGLISFAIHAAIMRGLGW